MSESNGDPRFQFFRRSVDQMLGNAGPRKISALRTLKAAAAKEEQRLVAEQPKVFLAVPAYSSSDMHDRAWAAFMMTPSDKENLDVIQGKYRNSLLCRGFNGLWVQALAARKTEGVTHFAMLHTDVAPEEHWLDKLWEEMLRVQADLLAAVIPIKSSLGLTSVAVDNPDNIWQPRRLTMTEVIEKLPDTFGSEAVIDAGLNPKRGLLLHNTGCWICDLRRPWVDAVDEQGYLKCYFTIDDCIQVLPNGEYFVGVQSEDWHFSRMVQTVDPNARLFSTRKIRVEHMGETGFPNDQAWGAWKTDQDADSEVEINQDNPVATEQVEEPEAVLA